MVEKLTDEQAGRLFKHVLRYVNDQNPLTEDMILQIAFEPIKQSLKRDLRNYESKCQKNRDNALMRWNKSDANECDRMQTDAKHADSDSDNDSDNDIDSDKKKRKIDKKKFADFVSLTDDEYKWLITEHGEKNTKMFITILNNYKGANGKKYKSDYLAILNWVVDKTKKEGKYDGKPMMM